MAEYSLTTPLTDENLAQLRAGDVVKLTGTIYTARDAAHKRLIDLLDKGDKLPFELQGAVVYYVGPSPAPEGRPIGSAGPTTSYRMDTYAFRLHSLGLKATVGKGKRSDEVKQALRDHTAVYFGATGGAGALLSQRIKEAKVIAFEELGPEAIRELTVEDFPLLVINDAHGNELYAVPDRPAAGIADYAPPA
ncbi:Fe-S-containing hydro-lyase [Desulfohalovibrio reitneri]|uniref:Fe-S-containing hydro-lyase n=1 Tax=Desulfohalovibrio reitneri TaxID=1307759 RepID=UPI0004A77611|nr:Fe-S-containing hydro-lyase [Desulfohalovibrio reitneri]